MKIDPRPGRPVQLGLSDRRGAFVSDSWDLDNPKKISEWRNRDPNEVWTAYFERLTLAAAIRALRNHRPC